ncbi:MAG: molybdenum ABC transporter ATP-binding protein [Desulfuromonas sp.]|nr:molybdenum ABC transporter ATP-binding protein [Desulfuromonas sp.]
MKFDIDLTKKNGNFQLNASFALEENRLGIFGPSGSGKSTLINLISGLLTGDSGHISLDEQWLYHGNKGINLPTNKRRIAVVFQHAHLFPHLLVESNLLYGYKRVAPQLRKLEPADVIEVLELEPLLKQRVTGLSGGERQRIALGRALLASPQLLILDEPLSALDHNLKEQIIPFLRRSLKRFAIPYLYISHSLSEMRRLTDQVLIVGNGQIAEITTAEKMALQRINSGQRGYINHVALNAPREVGDLLAYRWGSGELMLSATVNNHQGLFELSSKDIMLFKNNPGALSARNLLKMQICSMSNMGNSVAVTLEQGSQTLISQVTREAAAELELHPNQQVFVGIKASVFRPLS